MKLRAQTSRIREDGSVVNLVVGDMVRTMIWGDLYITDTTQEKDRLWVSDLETDTENHIGNFISMRDVTAIKRQGSDEWVNVAPEDSFSVRREVDPEESLRTEGDYVPVEIQEAVREWRKISKRLGSLEKQMSKLSEKHTELEDKLKTHILQIQDQKIRVDDLIVKVESKSRVVTPNISQQTVIKELTKAMYEYDAVVGKKVEDVTNDITAKLRAAKPSYTQTTHELAIESVWSRLVDWVKGLLGKLSSTLTEGDQKLDEVEEILSHLEPV